MVNSRAKGKRIELKVVQWIKDTFGWEARRSQQYCGTATADVDCSALPNVHIEVKGRKAHSCLDFLDQAKRDAAGKVPIVFLWEDGGRKGVLLDAELALWILHLSQK